MCPVNETSGHPSRFFWKEFFFCGFGSGKGFSGFGFGKSFYLIGICIWKEFLVDLFLQEKYHIYFLCNNIPKLNF